MNRDELIESVAKAVFERQHKGLRSCHTWDDHWEHNEPRRDGYLLDAQAAILATLQGIREATPGMVEAGSVSLDATTSTYEEPGWFNEDATAAWTAMLDHLITEHRGSANVGD